jgi:hypothetical protein
MNGLPNGFAGPYAESSSGFRIIEHGAFNLPKLLNPNELDRL